MDYFLFLFNIVSLQNLSFIAFFKKDHTRHNMLTIQCSEGNTLFIQWSEQQTILPVVWMVPLSCDIEVSCVFSC